MCSPREAESVLGPIFSSSSLIIPDPIASHIHDLHNLCFRDSERSPLGRSRWHQEALLHSASRNPLRSSGRVHRSLELPQSNNFLVMMRQKILRACICVNPHVHKVWFDVNLTSFPEKSPISKFRTPQCASRCPCSDVLGLPSLPGDLSGRTGFGCFSGHITRMIEMWLIRSSS